MADFRSTVVKQPQTEQGMLCAEFRELAQLIIDNEANDQEKQRFDHYIQQCRHCQEYYQIEKTTLHLIKTRTAQSPPCPAELKNQIKSLRFQ